MTIALTFWNLVQFGPLLSENEVGVLLQFSYKKVRSEMSADQTIAVEANYYEIKNMELHGSLKWQCIVNCHLF